MEETSAVEKSESKANLGEDYWLQELCLSNGLDPKSDLSQVELLELFLSVIPMVPSLNTYPSLTILRIVGCTITKIENLHIVPNLKELWLCEGKIQKLEGLEKNSKLEKLYMYKNELSKIENISHLLMLTTLWLNKNKIEVIENMEQLRQLKFLNLSDNQIHSIGTSLICCNLLEEVNLSGNRINSLKDITNISCLRNLIALDLKDPMCHPNPVTLLCNYSTYVLYHMPSLKRLDSVDVSMKMLKEAAESTVNKKRIFYKMRIRTIQRECIEMREQLKEHLENLREESVTSIHKLSNATKELERELDELSTKPEKLLRSSKDAESANQEAGEEIQNQTSLEEYREKLVAKLSQTKERCFHWHRVYKRMTSDFERVYQQYCQWTKQTIIYSQMEFSSGGNIRFEKGSSADVWYNSCQDLIQARFSPQEFKELGVSGVKIHKIRRIQNRLQKSRFEQKLESLSEGCTDDVIQYKDNSGKRLMDYLFLIPKVSGNIVDHFKIIEDGFHINTADHQESSTCSSAIQVTNNFRFLDKHRIKTTTTPPNKNDVKTNSDISFRYGQILICKVYLGKSCAVNNDKRLVESLYPGHQSVYRTKKHLATSCPSKVKKSLSTSATPQEYCECTARKCVWYLFDPDLVLPEYIVDFEYLSTVTPPMMSVFSELSKPTMSEEIRQQRFTEMCTKKPEEDTRDNNVLNLEPIIASRPRLTFLTEEMILKQSGQTYLNKITELNLHGCGLTKGKMLSSLSNIKKLVLSFNELTTMADLGGNSTLEYLDVSYNQITGMEGFKLCSNLTSLDIQWNRFYYTREDVGLIRKNIPALKYLKAAFNPWMKADSLRLRCIGRLRSLLSMDGEDVTQEETNTALRLAAGSRIAYITVLANSRTEKEPLRTLNLSNTTDVLITQSMNKPVKLSEDDRQWLSRVTCLRLDGQHLSKISNLEKLENLKWASFNDNDITKIEGLDNCKDLIELSLANNCLSKIDGIHHLKKLQSLDVSNNNLSALDGIDFASLNNLRFLAFDNNFVLSLNGLQHSTSLLEIYAGNNKLQELRDVFYLKNIPTLIILDMMGNPLVKECNNYRLFLIYHLQSLKALDGIPVNFTEGGMAKDTFGGKLSTDFIAEKLGHSNFLELCELDLPHCNIRTVDLNSSELFKNLRSLNLEQNNLSCFGGIVNLHNLKVLCLNHNHIESIFPKKSGTNSPQVISTNNKNASSDDSTNQFKAVLENLEVLHLGYNGIANLAALELGRLVSLKALFLQGNEINKVDGLDGLYELRELVLDKNKIKAFTENSFRNQWKLAELHVEENRLRDLSNLEPLTCLNRLYVGLNRLQYGTDLEKLECLPNLFELSVIGNPIARRMSHRMMLIFRQPNLLSIDGIPVSNEERSKAEIHFLEQQGGIQALQALSNSYDNSFPGLQSNNRNPLKVSNYTSSGPNERFWNPHHNEDKSRSKKNHRGSNKIPNNRYT